MGFASSDHSSLFFTKSEENREIHFDYFYALRTALSRIITMSSFSRFADRAKAAPEQVAATHQTTRVAASFYRSESTCSENGAPPPLASSAATVATVPAGTERLSASIATVFVPAMVTRTS